MIQSLEGFKAGHRERRLGYSYFMPSLLHGPWTYSTPALSTLLEQAALRLGELNSYARLVPNIDLFIHLHVTKEAVVSSRIEGTQTNFQEALMAKEDIDPERRDDWQEVVNYTQAMNDALASLTKLPLSSRLLRQTHARLVEGVRGEHKAPGQFRKSQNWIGGASLSDAVFIPPPHEEVDRLMGDLEDFIHSDQVGLPALIRIGMAHYQFETIHPFLDGNGRIGRLMITLYLISIGMLDRPLLYLSSFFEQNKSLYYDNLTRVRTHDDMVQWLKYFLTGVEQTARLASKTLAEILELKQKAEYDVQHGLGRRAASGMKLLGALLQNPITTTAQVMQVCGVTKKAANDLLEAFLKLGILKEASGRMRYRYFVYKDYMDKFSIAL